MISYTGGRSLYGTLTSNLQSTNLSTGDTLIANSIRELLAERNWDFLQIPLTIPTATNTQFYNLLSNVSTVKSVTVSIGTTNYFPQEVPSWAFWNTLNETTSYYSDIPEWYVVFDGQLGIWPTSASTAGTINLTAEQKIVDLGFADYVTGTITTATAAGSTIVGSGTTWTANMAGRWIQIAKSSGGDGVWYQIKSVTNTTTLVLVGAYNGLSISSGSATYIIGEASIVPEDFQMIPVLDAVWYYFQFIQPDQSRATTALTKRTLLYNKMVNKFGKKTSSMVIDYGQSNSMHNPNLTITSANH